MEVVEVLHLQNKEDDRIVSVQVSREQEQQLLTYALNTLIIRGILSIVPAPDSEEPDLATIEITGKPN